MSLYYALHATVRTLILPEKGKKGKRKEERRKERREENHYTAATTAYKVLTHVDHV